MDFFEGQKLQLVNLFLIMIYDYTQGLFLSCCSFANGLEDM